MKKTTYVFLTACAGISFILAAEFAILLGADSLKIWVTPLCWTGYILCIDGILYRKRDSSLIHDHPLEMFLSFPISTALWVIFEGYNLLLKNWEYLSVPTNPLIAYPGYFWSFGTILPALLETNDLLEYWGIFKKISIKPHPIPRKALLFSFLLGALMVIYPLFTATPFDFPPVWLGFIFLLEPVNYCLGGESLLKRFEEGKSERFFTLFATGGIMGFLWEFWNYWAGAKWVYHIPVPTDVKIFEMPLLGFLGFFPFALEFYIMYHSTRILFNRIYIRRHSAGRAI